MFGSCVTDVRAKNNTNTSRYGYSRLHIFIHNNLEVQVGEKWHEGDIFVVDALVSGRDNIFAKLKLNEKPTLF